MGVRESTQSQLIRQRLGYPVIDSDGHYVEVGPSLMDFIRETAGADLAERFMALRRSGMQFFTGDTPAERRARADTRYPFWWPYPTLNTLDRATALFPRLLSERLDQFGIDFTVLYPSHGLYYPHIAEEQARRGMCRALNAYNAAYFRDYADRMTPAALVPMHTPAEAIEALEHAVTVLGFKAILIPTYVRRPVQSLLASHPEAAVTAGTLDFYAIDSEHDYDPFWQRCAELKVVPTTHSSGMGWGARRSYSNFMYNHVGHFGAASEALCKALVIGGVTRRFPDLKFAFLEAGVGWACSLYADLIGHWKKRNPASLKNLDPANLDHALMHKLAAEYGDERTRARLEELRAYHQQPASRPSVDDWAACGIERPEQFRELFEPHFYFGCEADDPMNASAFNTRVNPYGAKLRGVLSSDIGHWDVTDMTDVLAEAYELVEDGMITEDNLRDFLFTHPVSLYATSNPDFFRGTRCEAEAARLLPTLQK